jgi:hypothetical protein
VTRPPLPSLLRFLPSPRYVASRAPGIVKFDAPCPHGSVVQWTALRDAVAASDAGLDIDARVICPCTCPEPLPAEEAA